MGAGARLTMMAGTGGPEESSLLLLVLGDPVCVCIHCVHLSGILVTHVCV